MGSENSKQVSGGNLTGAYAPPPAGVVLPTPPNPKKTYTVRVARGRKPGDTILVAGRNGERFEVTIPRGQKVGDSFQVTKDAEVHKVFASTLPTVPGMEIVQSKPLIWGSVSYSYSGGQQPNSMGKAVGRVMQDAQTRVMEQAINVGCNAVLGMTFNVTKDSHFKNVIVTAYGTPCLIVPKVDTPAVLADVIVEPPYCRIPAE